MNILHVISGLGTGGAEATLVQVAAGLADRGFKQRVVSITAQSDVVAEFKARGIDVAFLNATSVYGAIGATFELVRIIRNGLPDVVQGWMYHGDLLATLALRFVPRAARPRLFWNLRASNMDEKRYGRILRLNAWLSSMPDVIVANSSAGAGFHLKHGFKPRHEIKVIHNGIDIERFCPDARARESVRADLGIPPDAIVAIHVARLDPMKDHALFMKAMASLPELHGLMVGKGTEGLATPLNVRAVGQRRDTERYYAAADLVVSTSAFGEGFSNAVAEGMSVGLVPIVTDVGDARQLVGDTGEIIAPGDSSALTAAISRHAGVPVARRRERGLRARERIAQEFTIERTVAEFADLYLTQLAPCQRGT